MKSSIARRSMITRQRGDQRRRKFHVCISTVCLFRIFTLRATSIEDDAKERAGRKVLARGRESAKREGLAKNREFELCVARTTLKNFKSIGCLML